MSQLTISAPNRRRARTILNRVYRADLSAYFTADNRAVSGAVLTAIYDRDAREVVITSNALHQDALEIWVGAF